MALARGVQRHVMACAKHFALNSMENARFKVDVTIDPRALHEVYLTHFKRVVDAGVASVMSAYNSLNGEWCGQNRPLLTGILKDQWGFQGYLMTDFIFGMRDAAKAALAVRDAASNSYQVSDAGGSFTFANPNFSWRELKSNPVLRWEYQTGSTVYVIWTQNRTSADFVGDFSAGSEYRRLFRAHPDNTFLIKFSYWFSI